MKVSMGDVRTLPRSAQWKLYITSFPVCVDQSHTWPVDQGIDVSYAIITPSSDRSEGKISVTFLDDLSGKTRLFLHDWQEGVSETNTGKQRPTKDLLANVSFRDQNATEPDLDIVLKFPTDCEIGSETPNFRAIYYDQKTRR